MSGVGVSRWLPVALAFGCAGAPTSDEDIVDTDDTDDTEVMDTDATDVVDTDDGEVEDTDDTEAVDTDDGEVTETDDTDSGGASGGGCVPGASAGNAALGTVVCVPAGTFTMGCVAGRDDVAWGCDGDESPSRAVTLTRSFWVMEAEVTQARYAAVVGSNPSYFRGANLPVETVSWDDAVAFADAVSVAQRLTPCGSGDPYACDGWRLPTEAEWEYAARGGQNFPYAGSSTVDSVAWYFDNSSSTTRAVCTKARNGFGLCDMSGNVFEWSSDWYAAYPSTASTDPTGPASGSFRVLRGGDWGNYAQIVRVADRFGDTPGGDGGRGLGFRLVRSVP